MKILDYLRPRLVGDRFDGHAIPLEFLRDFVALQDMVVETVRRKYLTDHAGKRRAPRGFYEGLTLTLSGVEEGSAVPVITLSVGDAPGDALGYYLDARSDIMGAIRAASGDGSPTTYLPERALSYFNGFGISLRDNEAIEFPAADRSQPPARLTREVRRRLQLAATASEGLTDECSVRGAVHEINRETSRCQITTADGAKVSAPLAEPHLDTLMEAINGYPVVKVLIRGVGRFSRSQKLQEVETIESVAVLEPRDIGYRLEELGNLRSGWRDGRGVPPSAEGLAWATAALTRRYPDELPLPYIYADGEGGLRLEWPSERVEASLEIDLVTKAAYWHVLDLTTDGTAERELDLSGDPDWDWVFRELAGLGGVGPRDR